MMDGVVTFSQWLRGNGLSVNEYQDVRDDLKFYVVAIDGRSGPIRAVDPDRFKAYRRAMLEVYNRFALFNLPLCPLASVED